MCTTPAQRLRHWFNIVQMLYKCFLFAGMLVRDRDSSGSLADVTGSSRMTGQREISRERPNSRLTSALLCQVKMQQLLTLQVSNCCLLEHRCPGTNLYPPPPYLQDNRLGVTHTQTYKGGVTRTDKWRKTIRWPPTTSRSQAL